jgi:hypothetical protein
MGIRDFINTQTIKAQNKQSDFMAKNMALILESTMKKKVERLQKENRPVTVENLVSGCEALEKVGLTREDVIRVAIKYEEGYVGR